jgi:hypothetical protein
MKYKIILLFLFCGFSAIAQDTDTAGFYLSPYRKAQKLPKLIVKWAFLSLIDPDRTVQFGAEYFLTSRLSLQTELGYGKFLGYNGSNAEPRRIWRSRNEIRLYLSDYQYADFIGYLALEGFYKQVYTYKNETVARGCQGLNCNYYEIVRYAYQKDVWGINLKGGGQVFLGKRVLLDMYLGVGLREIAVKTPDKPSEADNGWLSEDGVLDFSYDQGYYHSASLVIGVKLGYLIR